MRVRTTTAKVLIDGFTYLEGMRWHRGKIWASDVPEGKVYEVDPCNKDVNLVAAIPDGHTSGLGFLQDGTPLVVEQLNSTLNRIVDGSTEIVATLDHVAIGGNDMWVDRNGRAYISQIGFDLFGGGEIETSSLIVVDTDNSVSTAGEGLICPNGIGLSPNGKTLYTAETFSARVTAFDRDPSTGVLSNQRVLRQYEDVEADGLDGLVIDAAGGIWVTAPFRSEVHRLDPRNGEITDIVKTAHPGHMVVTVALGGPLLRTLYMGVANTTLEGLLVWDSTAAIEYAQVRWPGINPMRLP